MPTDLVLGGSFTRDIERGLKTHVHDYCAGCISGGDSYLFPPMLTVVSKGPDGQR